MTAKPSCCIRRWQRFYPPSRRLVIPARLTECGGVTLAEALDVLVAELQRVATVGSISVVPAKRRDP